MALEARVKKLETEAEHLDSILWGLTNLFKLTQEKLEEVHEVLEGQEQLRLISLELIEALTKQLEDNFSLEKFKA